MICIRSYGKKFTFNLGIPLSHDLPPVSVKRPGFILMHPVEGDGPAASADAVSRS